MVELTQFGTFAWVTVVTPPVMIGVLARPDRISWSPAGTTLLRPWSLAPAVPVSMPPTMMSPDGPTPVLTFTKPHEEVTLTRIEVTPAA